MRLKLSKQHPASVDKKVDELLKPYGKFLTEEQLAGLLGMNVNMAVKKAVELNFSRIHIKNSRYYAKKQIRAYLILEHTR